jgi:hypothetical protein
MRLQHSSGHYQSALQWPWHMLGFVLWAVVHRSCLSMRCWILWIIVRDHSITNALANCSAEQLANCYAEQLANCCAEQRANRFSDCCSQQAKGQELL